MQRQLADWWLGRRDGMDRSSGTITLQALAASIEFISICMPATSPLFSPTRAAVVLALLPRGVGPGAMMPARAIWPSWISEWSTSSGKANVHGIVAENLSSSGRVWVARDRLASWVLRWLLRRTGARAIDRSPSCERLQGTGPFAESRAGRLRERQTAVADVPGEFPVSLDSLCQQMGRPASKPTD
jgi:hypothetical protein